MRRMTPAMLKSYMIAKQGKSVGTRPETLFDQFQRSRGLGLVMNVSLPFHDAGARYDFQLDFASSALDVDYEIDGKEFHSSDRQVRKDAWKDGVKNAHGLKVVHVPAILTERHWWEYLEREIRRALASEERTVYIEA
jgi:hypothetical protein